VEDKGKKVCCEMIQGILFWEDILPSIGFLYVPLSILFWIFTNHLYLKIFILQNPIWIIFFMNVCGNPKLQTPPSSSMVSSLHSLLGSRSFTMEEIMMIKSGKLGIEFQNT
jgi:hypothetical protein